MDETDKRTFKAVFYVLFFVWYFMGIALYAVTNSLLFIFIGVVGAVGFALGIEALSPIDAN